MAAVAVGFFAFSFLGAEEVNKSEIEPILSSTAVIVFHHFASGVSMYSVPKSICILPVSTRDEKYSPIAYPASERGARKQLGSWRLHLGIPMSG
jgi:hypothetical protein